VIDYIEFLKTKYSGEKKTTTIQVWLGKRPLWFEKPIYIGWITA
jgi:hypothetical protein